MLRDPVFWCAVVLIWTGLLVFAVCVCSANTRAEVTERERNNALKKISGGGGWTKR